MKKIYYMFFPKDKQLPFPKLRWIIMVIIQELLMGKYKAVIKYFIKPSYHRDINVLRDILSKGRLTGKKGELYLGQINYSHELNYPKWVDVLVEKLQKNPDDYKRIKVILHENTYLVVDGNHRLKAMNHVFLPFKKIRVLILEYNGTN